jgi:hypothetical protein
MDMDFAAEISYLAREPLYKQEKPYSADFEPGSGIKQSNHVYNVTRAKIRNITDPSQFRLDTHGFCILQSPLSMRPEDVLSDHRLIQDAYFAEMEELIHRHFPEYERVDAMSMTVRKRDARFPVAEESEPFFVTHEQPAPIPHSDFSLRGKDVQLEMAFPGQTIHFKDRDYDLIKCVARVSSPLVVLTSKQHLASTGRAKRRLASRPVRLHVD